MDTKVFAKQEFKNMIRDLKKIVVVPAPSLAEEKRAQFLRRMVAQLGYKGAKIDAAGNLAVRLKGKSSERVVFSAHMDTVFPAHTPLRVTGKGNVLRCPGICDNTVSLVTLLYLMKYIRKARIRPGCTADFLFNVGEEGLGDLRGVRHYFDHTNRKRIKAHVAIEGGGLGRLTPKGIGSLRREFTVTCEGGHSWGAFGKPNAIVEASRLIARLSKIKLSKKPKATLSIGTISGGTSINTIAPECVFAVDTRSIDGRALRKVNRDIDREVRSTKKPGVEIKWRVVGNRPAGDGSGKKIVGIVKDVHKRLGIETKMGAGSTDCNYPISLGIPSVCIAVARGKGIHTVDESLDIRLIPLGMQQIIELFAELAGF